MVIPEERMTAAFWVFQFSVVTMVVKTMSIPYNSMVIAMERMGAFAYIDVLNTFLKLCAVIVLQYLSWDKLILYAFFIMLIQILTRYIYTSYCSRNFSEAKYHFSWNQTVVKRMLGFSFWTVFSSVAAMLMTNGMSILYNRFYGVIANAAIGIGNQVMMAVRKLTANMSISFAPQIVKRYSEGDFAKVSIVWTIGSKCTFFLFSLFTIPIVMNAHYILDLWLDEVPLYAPEFMTLLLIENLTRCFSSNASAIVRASGKIRNYELISNVVRLVFFTLVVIGFFVSDNIFMGYYIYIGNTIFHMIYNVYIGCKNINYSIKKYYLNNIALMVLSTGVTAVISYLLLPEVMNILSFILHVISTICILIVSFCLICLLPDERKYLLKILQGVLSKNFNHK
jgi:O-antigen/teichoic acid export membrane protein